MSLYALQFDPRALKEWRGLDRMIQAQFKKTLARRLEAPQVEASRLSGGLGDCYRLVYRVIDSQVVVLVLAIGERNQSRAYEQAGKRL